jgi:hypothetical protein
MRLNSPIAWSSRFPSEVLENGLVESFPEKCNPPFYFQVSFEFFINFAIYVSGGLQFAQQRSKQYLGIHAFGTECQFEGQWVLSKTDALLSSYVSKTLPQTWRS